MPSAKVLEIVDRLALERGEKSNGFYRLTLTTEELMEPLGIKPSVAHHRYVRNAILTYYQVVSTELIGRDDSQGFKLHIKIRSK